MYQKNFSENKNDVNENFKATIKVGAYIFLHWYLKKKNCKQISWHKSEKFKARINFKAASKTWALKNMDPEKHVINMNLKNVSLESLIKKMHNAICSLKVHVLTLISEKNLSG